MSGLICVAYKAGMNFEDMFNLITATFVNIIQSDFTELLEK